MRTRPTIDFTNVQSATKQSFRDEVNINNIVAKYQRTGLIDHVQDKRPRYGDISSTDFKQAMDTVAEAKSLFETLPSASRREFVTVEGFLDWAQDPDNAEDLSALERGEWPWQEEENQANQEDSTMSIPMGMADNEQREAAAPAETKEPAKNS